MGNPVRKLVSKAYRGLGVLNTLSYLLSPSKLPKHLLRKAARKNRLTNWMKV